MGISRSPADRMRRRAARRRAVVTGPATKMRGGLQKAHHTHHSPAIDIAVAKSEAIREPTVEATLLSVPAIGLLTTRHETA